MSALQAAAQTHPGRVRLHNEDNYVCLPERGLFAVIDGMGGEAAGEVAAALAREAVINGVNLADSLLRANETILDHADANPRSRGMGCVLTAAEVLPQAVRLAHVGDTRAYLVSRAGCEQLTPDHTRVAEHQEDLGLTEAAARTLPRQHAVTRDLGGRRRVGTAWIERLEAEFTAGDILLLCSDGLHDLVSQAEIFAALAQARRGQEAPKALVARLVALALERGGRDNVTVLAICRAEEHTPGWSIASIRPGLMVVVASLLAATLGFSAGRMSAAAGDVGEAREPHQPVLEDVVVEELLDTGLDFNLDAAAEEL